MRPLLLLLAACGYITDPKQDPADPTLFSLQNATNDVLYLPLDPVRIDGARISATCERVCSDPCGVVPCTAPIGMRALQPGEAIIVEWNNMFFDEETSQCGGKCVRARRAEKGRFDARACFARNIGGNALMRGADGVITGATPVDETCTAPLNFSWPNPDVHWGIDLY